MADLRHIGILLSRRLVAVQGGSQQRSFSGSGANEDIVVASARAYVSALNKLIAFMAASQRAAGAAAAAVTDEAEMAPTH